MLMQIILIETKGREISVIIFPPFFLSSSPSFLHTFSSSYNILNKLILSPFMTNSILVCHKTEIVNLDECVNLVILRINIDINNFVQ